MTTKHSCTPTRLAFCSCFPNTNTLGPHWTWKFKQAQLCWKKSSQWLLLVMILCLRGGSWGCVSTVVHFQMSPVGADCCVHSSPPGIVEVEWVADNCTHGKNVPCGLFFATRTFSASRTSWGRESLRIHGLYEMVEAWVPLIECSEFEITSLYHIPCQPDYFDRLCKCPL